ncbi:NEDD4-binding protein 1 isoform X2 [Anabrus simplex]|uniref:NEDD4-binding protein 1 isoform X2 n=1 Tax=Anabrus simplex TaxID=316456 RepID=UPI0035A2A559
MYHHAVNLQIHIFLLNQNSAVEGGQCIKPRKIQKLKHRIGRLTSPVLNESNKEAVSSGKEDLEDSIRSNSSSISLGDLTEKPKQKKKTKDNCKQIADMGIPEIIIADDIISPQDKNQSPSTSGNKQDVVVLSSASRTNKRKSLNESVVVLQEVRVDHTATPPAKRRRVKEVGTDTITRSEILNNSVINLCDDEVSIVEVDIVSPKQSATPAEDIILLDSTPKVAGAAKTVPPVAIKGSKRNGTCTVTTGASSSSSNYASLLEVFRQNNECVADNTVSSTSSFFAFDKGGHFPFKNRRKNLHHRRRRMAPITSDPSSSEQLVASDAPSSYGSNTNSKQPAGADGSNPFGSNIYNPNPQTSQMAGALRPIIIDGSNVALGHSNGARIFSCRGLQICVNYFAKRGHKVIAFVPQFRKSDPSVTDRHIFDDLLKAGQIVFTPSRRVEGRLVVSYDDRYIVQYAAEFGGIIVSTDNYRDLLQENEAWRDTIQNRLLMFTWVGDLLMFPLDPLGRHGPKLDEFLRFPP